MSLIDDQGVRSMTITSATANARRTDPKGTRVFPEENGCAKRYSSRASFIIIGIGFFQIIPGGGVHDSFDMLNRCRELMFSFPNVSRLRGSDPESETLPGTAHDAEPGGS